MNFFVAFLRTHHACRNKAIYILVAYALVRERITQSSVSVLLVLMPAAWRISLSKMNVEERRKELRLGEVIF